MTSVAALQFTVLSDLMLQTREDQSSYFKPKLITFVPLMYNMVILFLGIKTSGCIITATGN